MVTALTNAQDSPSPCHRVYIDGIGSPGQHGALFARRASNANRRLKRIVSKDIIEHGQDPGEVRSCNKVDDHLEFLSARMQAVLIDRWHLLLCPRYQSQLSTVANSSNQNGASNLARS